MRAQECGSLGNRAQAGEPGAAGAAAGHQATGHTLPAPLRCRNQEPSTAALEPSASPNLLLKTEAKLFGGPTVIAIHQTVQPSSSGPRDGPWWFLQARADLYANSHCGLVCDVCDSGRLEAT